MTRKLFCEISPFTYKLSEKKECWKRWFQNTVSELTFAKDRSESLAEVVYRHNSLIRRKLGNVDMQLQENKAVNLTLAAKNINGILIHPGETFSLWRLVGPTTAKRGYLEGLVIKCDQPSTGIGGGLCQLSNLLHWMVLHSPLVVTERHHHNRLDLFPDFGRQVPFGCGTSILYNYLDYRFYNPTAFDFQIVVYTTDTYLSGELRSSLPLTHSYHIAEEDMHFIKAGEQYYRHNKIYRIINDKRTGKQMSKTLIEQSNAKVLYDAALINPVLMRNS